MHWPMRNWRKNRLFAKVMTDDKTIEYVFVVIKE